MITNQTIGRASFDVLSNDLFWDIWVPAESEFIRWSGYNDAFWWRSVAPSEQFQIRIGKATGTRYRLNPETNEVTIDQ